MQNETTSLAISSRYPADKYNVLIPMQTVTEISAIQKPVMNAVKISTNLEDKEIYIQEKSKPATNKYPATPNRYALSKKGLTKLMRAAGIKIIQSKSMLPTTCLKCAEVNRNIGKPINCGSCPNKDVKYEVTISVPQLTGESINLVASKEIIVDDVTSDMTPNQKKEFLKFRNEMCESKALNRALRTAMQIKNTYLIEEFEKPFVVAYLVPNLDNPDVKEEAIKNMFGSAGNLFGEAKTHTIVLDEETQTETEEAEAPRYQQAPSPESQRDPGADPECCKCHSLISEKVMKYSMEKYNMPLCMACQNKQGGAR